MDQILQWLGTNGGTLVMAGLFVYVFFQDRQKNTKLLEDNARMLDTLAKSNDNIAESLSLIKENMVTIDHKIDRNYEVELKRQ